MKKDILTLIIGILIGAIITTAVFLVIKGTTSNAGNRMNRENMEFMNGDFQNNLKDFVNSNEDSNQNTEENIEDEK